MTHVMTDYSTLVQRLRGEHGTEPWQVNPAAKIAADAIELLQRELKCANELWEQQKELALEYLADIEKANERIAELEDALEAQAKRIACLEAPLCIGETTIRILAKEGAKVFENGQGLVAADELFKQDPYDRIAELSAALKPFADEAQFFSSKALDNHLAAPHQLYLTIGEFRAARKVLGEKE